MMVKAWLVGWLVLLMVLSKGRSYLGIRYCHRCMYDYEREKDLGYYC